MKLFSYPTRFSREERNIAKRYARVILPWICGQIVYFPSSPPLPPSIGRGSNSWKPSLLSWFNWTSLILKTTPLKTGWLGVWQWWLGAWNEGAKMDNIAARAWESATQISGIFQSLPKWEANASHQRGVETGLRHLQMPRRGSREIIFFVQNKLLSMRQKVVIQEWRW